MKSMQLLLASAETDKTGKFNWDTVSLFWDLGLLQIMLPEEYGGYPRRPCSTLCLCIEEIAKACASSALLLVIQAVGSFPLIHAGNEAQKKKYLPRISEKRTLMGYLVSEPGAGSDVAHISTSAQKKSHEYIINGSKIFSTNGGVAGLYSVLARTGKNETSFFLLEREQQGVFVGREEDKCGFRGSNTAYVSIEDAHVPEENLLGRAGDGFLIAMADFVDYEKNALYRVVELSRMETARWGVPLVETEFYGMVPAAAMLESLAYYMQLTGFSPDQVLELRLLQSLSEQDE